MTRPSDTPRVPPVAGAPTPEDGAELRRRLAGLVARHGASVGRAPEARLECETELSPLYSGPYAVRVWAVVQALKGGLVDELLRWSHTGTPGGFDDLVRRLADRSGAPQQVAEWALAEWLSQLRHDERHPTSHAPSASVVTPAAAAAVVEAPPRKPRGPATVALNALPGPDVVVRIPHLVLGGLALAAALAVGLLLWRPGAPGIGVLGEASASTPALPPAPTIEEAPARERVASACAAERDPGPDRPPRALQAGAVPMPDEALEVGLDDGWARVRLQVDADGEVRDESVEVIDASHPAIAESVGDVVARLRYRPARRDGCTVPATITRTLRFSADAEPLS